MAKTDKAKRIKARLPRGLQDHEAGTLRATADMLEAIRTVFERYGFEPVETPIIEYTEALGKFLPDQDRPNEGVFSFLDDDEQWLSLRYDLTAPLARHVAENFDRLPKPYRTYRAGHVFRNEKPGPGRFRQFMQFDADTVGAPGVAADAEMCMLMADTLEALGIKRGDYVIRVNNRKVLDGVMEAIGLAGEEHAGTRLTVLRAIDKLDRVGIEGVQALLGPGRKDESGDFTKGAGLGEEQINKLLVFASLHTGLVTPLQDVTNKSKTELSGLGPTHTFDSASGSESQFVETNIGVIDAMLTHFGSNPTSRTGVLELQEIAELVTSAGYSRDRIRIDPSVVRGLEYYTGPVYEAELTFETVNEKGEKARFGSVAGGGRYDGLVARFRGEPVPATGFSIGVSRLLAALSALGRIDTGAARGPVVVLIDRDDVSITNAQRMVAALRDAGIRAEMYLGASRNFGPQMKYADRRGAPCVVIQGENERNQDPPVVQVKDLVLGAELSGQIETREEWREARPAQVEVPESELVATVRGILDRRKP